MPDEEVPEALWAEIGRIRGAASFLYEHAQAKKLVLAKAKVRSKS